MSWLNFVDQLPIWKKQNTVQCNIHLELFPNPRNKIPGKTKLRSFVRFLSNFWFNCVYVHNDETWIIHLFTTPENSILGQIEINALFLFYSPVKKIRYVMKYD